ncbi:MAG: hypothetical protein AAFR97_08910, partial [Bacteroidota bacterium]
QLQSFCTSSKHGKKSILKDYHQHEEISGSDQIYPPAEVQNNKRGLNWRHSTRRSGKDDYRIR